MRTHDGHGRLGELGHSFAHRAQQQAFEAADPASAEDEQVSGVAGVEERTRRQVQLDVLFDVLASVAKGLGDPGCECGSVVGVPRAAAGR